MADKERDDPGTTSIAYDAMLPKWHKIQTVLNGTASMRAAKTAFLPQHPMEENEAYEERLRSSVLLNLTEITQNSWVGRPFSDPMKFEDVPPAMEELFRDIDLTGNDIHVFCRRWFADGLAKGFSHAYIDFPRVDTEGRTLADDMAENVRPYWVHIQPEDIFFADAETIDGKEVLREIRIMEHIKERDGFAEVITPQIRRVFIAKMNTEDGDIVDVSMVELYRPKKRRKGAKVQWELYESYSFDLPVIPLVTFYADRKEFMMAKPPLEDLADLNIAHWQSSSDQRGVLTVARFPLLAASGVSEDVVIGPRKLLSSDDKDAKFYYVEHTGRAIEAGRKDLEALESQMAEYGAEFLKKRPGGMTATARALDSAEATSPLQDMTIRFTHAVREALELMAMWMNMELPDDAKAILATDFGPEEATQPQLTTLLAARKNRDISREAFLQELIRLGLIREDFDIEEDAEKIEQEIMDAFGGEIPDPNEDDEETEEEDDEESEEEEDD